MPTREYTLDELYPLKKPAAKTMKVAKPEEGQELRKGNILVIYHDLFVVNGNVAELLAKLAGDEDGLHGNLLAIRSLLKQMLDGVTVVINYSEEITTAPVKAVGK